MKKYFASYLVAVDNGMSFGSIWFTCKRLTVKEIEEQSHDLAKRNGYKQAPVFLSITEIEED